MSAARKTFGMGILSMFGGEGQQIIVGCASIVAVAAVATKTWYSMSAPLPCCAATPPCARQHVHTPSFPTRARARALLLGSQRDLSSDGPLVACSCGQAAQDPLAAVAGSDCQVQAGAEAGPHQRPLSAAARQAALAVC